MTVVTLSPSTAAAQCLVWKSVLYMASPSLVYCRRSSTTWGKRGMYTVQEGWQEGDVHCTGGMAGGFYRRGIYKTVQEKIPHTGDHYIFKCVRMILWLQNWTTGKNSKLNYVQNNVHQCE